MEVVLTRLNQILAVEKGAKNRGETTFTQIYQSLQKTDLMGGFSKTYQPRDDDGEKFPPENKRVQTKTEELLKKCREALTELFDVTATKDATNCVAKADVVVDGVVLLKDVPATHLLFLEKKLVDLLTFCRKLPTLSQDEDWIRDEAQGLWATRPVVTVKTKKVEEFPVIVPATKEHPAQVVKTVKDVTIGAWTTVKFSSALPFDRIEKLIDRVEKLQRAVKYAREEANSVEVVQLRSGDAILGYIFG
jgi:hypothetical protein